MTVTEELFQQIESDRFAALVNVASNLKTFLRALDAQPEVRELAAALASAEARSAVLARVTELTGRATDLEYEHPADSALATYLWLLSRADATAASAAAARVERCARCWWARKVLGAIGAGAPSVPNANGMDRTGPAPAEIGKNTATGGG